MEITRPVPSPNPVEQTDAALLQTAEEVSDAVFRSVPLPPLMREHFWVQSSVFAGCIFPAPVLQGSHFTDVTFRNCDLSNADLSGCSFQRVEFVECKLVGANLSEGTWQHVVFERCKMEFANFTLGKFRGVRFAGGTMHSVGFDECRFERVEFSLCDLTMAEFSRTRLKGLSFVDSDIQNVMSSVRGLDRCVAVICGSGVVVFGSDGKTLRRAGGYGHLLDDGGSSYHIGHDVLRACLMMDDGILQPSLLLQLAEKKLGGNVRARLDWLYARGV